MRHAHISTGRVWIPLVALLALLLIAILPNNAHAVRQVHDSTGSSAARNESAGQSVSIELGVKGGVARVLRVRDASGDAGKRELRGISKRPRYTIFADVILAVWNVDGIRVWPHP